MADVKYFADLVTVTPGVITDNKIMAMQSDPKGAAGWKPTMVQLKNYFGEGQESFDATVGPAGSGADYNDIQTAIAAAKYNLLIVGDFTQPTNVTSNANLLTLTIAKTLRVVGNNFAIGSGSVKVRRGSFVPVFTGGTNKLFTSAGLATLDIADCSIDMTGCIDPTAGIASMFAGSQHKIHNCKIALSDNSDCGFLAPGASSSFTNLDVIGAGSNCEGFITSCKDSVIADINISGTVKNAASFIAARYSPCVISNIRSTATGRFILDLVDGANQVSGINGDIDIWLNATTLNQISDCYITAMTLSDVNANRNQFVNVVVTTAALNIGGDENLFANCEFSSTVTLAVTSSGNQFWQCSSVGGFTDSGINNSINLTNINSAGMLTGGAITDAGGETINVTLGTGFLRITDLHIGILERISWPASAGIAIPTDTVRYVGVEYNSGTPQVIIKSTDLWNTHTEFRLGSVVNENTTLRILDNPWMIANAPGHAIERFFETLPFKRADRIGGLIIGETGTRNVTVTASEIYDLTNEFTIAAIDTSVSGGFDTYLGLTIQAAASTQWDNLNYNNAGVLTALGLNKWGTLWWYIEADGNLVMNYGVSEHNTQAGADLAPEPSVRPVRVQVHGTLIGRTVFQKSAVTGDFQSVFTTQFAGAGSSDHTQLSNLTTGDAGHTQFLPLDGSKSMSGDLNMTGTGGIKAPAGTTAQRPGSPLNGHRRYNTTTSKNEFYVNGAWINYASGPGPGILDKQNIIYVNGAGNDSNSGKNDEQPKLTIASALTAAAAQTPSATKIVVVKVLGGQRYAEDVTIPSWVVLDMSDALSYGQVTVGVTMGADSFYYFNEALMPSGKESIRCTGTGIRYIKGNFTTPETNSTFLTASGGATIYLDIINADAVKTGATFYTLLTGATLFLKAQTFRETVASTSVGATVFRNVVDDGANADTNNINTTGDQLIRGKDKVTLGTSAAASILELNGSYQKWNVNPHFIAYNDAELSNITGDATLADIAMNQTDVNVGTFYNTSTGVFTAPVTGLYIFNIVLFADGLIATHNDINIRLLTTTANWYLTQGNPQYMKSGASGDLILNGSIEVLMNSSNTAKFQIQVSGATKVVDVQIGSTCSGRLLTRT